MLFKSRGSDEATFAVVRVTEANLTAAILFRRLHVVAATLLTFLGGAILAHAAWGGDSFIRTVLAFAVGYAMLLAGLINYYGFRLLLQRLLLHFVNLGGLVVACTYVIAHANPLNYAAAIVISLMALSAIGRTVFRSWDAQ